ncbi:hypothetical protein LTS08_003825 [Lithohypha guttulata]|nr:hypothetical protein LTS08_003825 [Lithohypha guttulata]
MSFTFKSDGPKARPERVKPIPSQPSLSRSRSSSIASTASFASAVENHHDHHASQSETPSAPPKPAVHFSSKEENEMIEASHSLKAAANKQFATKDYSSAISTYDKALAELPIYLDYELAVLQSNIAACHLQLKEWKEAITSAEQGLENLEREMPMPKQKQKPNMKDDKPSSAKNNSTPAAQQENNEDQIVELPDDEDEEATAEALRKLNLSDQRKTDITRIRTKLLLRRARAKVMICEQPPPTTTSTASLSPDTDPESETTPTPPQRKKPLPNSILETGSHWSHLSTALADYQTLSTPEYFRTLPPQDQKTVIEMLRSLPARVEEAKKRDVDEMMGKLKDLGNGLLKPFGLSTDMFKMTQDPKTGGWSMNFGK